MSEKKKQTHLPKNKFTSVSILGNVGKHFKLKLQSAAALKNIDRKKAEQKQKDRSGTEEALERRGCGNKDAAPEAGSVP